MANAPRSLQAFYGGTFDPIHYGHLKPVEALAQVVGLSQVTILPNNVPPHRPQPQASSEQRKTMVELAIAGNPLFRIDCRELERQTPSWTVDTFEALRREAGPQQPLAFIIGLDSLLSLPTWQRYTRLIELCHLLVSRRPGYPVTMREAQHQTWLEAHLTTDVAALRQLPAGKIFLADTPQYDISATDIRERLAQHQPCDDLLPGPVLQYILSQKLYR
ncbi:nicotinate-nucleotide adenylyltransferase [Entomohabitans teleogrylli]|uniref:nicotinate-nucleotide adenylyltransferase n=1 Tax=Entomohabitans teleogrylli TaxID=1384589 RepID=UPI00073D4289|nr:nicotinate-nucleotide adenylyltransferase [Entomohabitans teleogrylli]